MTRTMMMMTTTMMMMTTTMMMMRVAKTHFEKVALLYFQTCDLLNKNKLIYGDDDDDEDDDDQKFKKKTINFQKIILKNNFEK